jgi:putative transcription factor
MQCDLCGKDTPILLLTNIEGSQLSLCKGCAQHGKVVRVIHKEVPVDRERHSSPVQRAEDGPKAEVIVEEFSVLIKAAREKLNLKQEEVAKKLNEKESLIQALESGHHHPNLELAKKFEHFYHITLTEVVKEEQIVPRSGSSSAFTLGDFIKVKK